MWVTDTAQVPHCCGCSGLAAVAPSRPLAWEFPYAADAALKKKKKKVLFSASFTNSNAHRSQESKINE